MAGIFNQKGHLQTLAKLSLLYIRQFERGLNWYKFLGESDLVFVGDFFQQLASDFDEISWKTFAITRNVTEDLVKILFSLVNAFFQEM